METKIIFTLAFLIILVYGRNIEASGDQHDLKETTKPIQFKPLQNSLLNQQRPNGSKLSENHTENHKRVKRQYSYGRDRYYPLPVIFGGFGYPVIGPRGFGPRGYGGRGFGGRGFGGRGIGGRGIGGRGIGGRGIGGRGGIGGGRGGRG